MTYNSRLQYIDTAKGIGIILVVVAHTSTPLYLHNIIYQFHMPLFFILSGFFYEDKYDKSPVPFIIKRIKSLYFPYVRYGFILLFSFMTLNFFLTGTTGYSFLGLSKVSLFLIIGIGGVPLGGALWFLRSLFIVIMLFLGIRFLLTKINIPDKIKNILLFGLIFICLIAGYNTQLPYNISSSLVALFFYYIGYLYRKYNDFIKPNVFIAIISFVVVLLSALINTVDMAYNTYSYLSLFILSSLCGIYLIVYSCKSGIYGGGNGVYWKKHINNYVVALPCF
jgi:fucose 4-O-acetylase-like acetyltransferase